jgi:hypothetical protein
MSLEILQEYVAHVGFYNAVIAIAAISLIAYVYYLFTDITLYDVKGKRIPLPNPFLNMIEARKARQVCF